MTFGRATIPVGINLPNILTVCRIILTFVLVYLIWQNGLVPKILAFCIFVMASLTDFFDGYYAKKHKINTDFGVIMDPIADKFLMLTVFCIFAQMHLIAFWMFVVILIREVWITLSRLLAVKKGRVIAAEKAGKLKTVFQIVAACFIFIYIILKESNFSDRWSESALDGWHYSIDALMIVTVALTLISGFSYFLNNRQPAHV